MPDSDYRTTLDRLYRLRRFGMRPGLEVIRGLLGALGDPQLTFPSVHVTGSKGKGSVAAMAASILSRSGRRTGRFTSPHLTSYRERIEVDGRPISKRDVVDGVARIEAATDSLLRQGTIDRHPTFFEVTTALAFDHFRRRDVSQAVVEVGIGGRLDSTNVLDSRVGVITTIEAEHTDVLGTTLVGIAREKAGIFHPGALGVVGALPPEAHGEVTRHARELGVPLWLLHRELDASARELFAGGQRFSIRTPSRTLEVDLRLLGRFQADNAALAVGAIERFAERTGVSISNATIREGLHRTRWRGRLERLARRPDLFVDVGHTIESAGAVAESLGEIAPFEDPRENAILFGCLKDKPAERILDRLVPLAQTVVLVPVRSERARPVSELVRAAQGKFPRIAIAPSAVEGLALARAATGEEGFTLVFGSDYLAGELLRAIERRDEEEPDLSDPLSTSSAETGPGGHP